jgi:hypothetical protein
VPPVEHVVPVNPQMYVETRAIEAEHARVGLVRCSSRSLLVIERLTVVRPLRAVPDGQAPFSVHNISTKSTPSGDTCLTWAGLIGERPQSRLNRDVPWFGHVTCGASH